MNGKLQLAGWALFVICAALFIVSGLKSRDILLTAASVIFLAACFLFIADLLKR